MHSICLVTCTFLTLSQLKISLALALASCIESDLAFYICCGNGISMSLDINTMGKKMNGNHYGLEWINRLSDMWKGGPKTRA